MASDNRKANAWTRSPEGAELNDAVLSVLAHELGGIAGALDLRAAALMRTIPPNDVAALRGLAEEVRASTRAVRLLRSTDDSGKLNPGRTQSLADWWRLAAAPTRAVLPRGTTVETTFDESRLTATHGNVLTWIWLAACRDLAELLTETGTPVALRGREEAGMLGIRADVTLEHAPSTDSRWSRHAAEIASTAGLAGPLWNWEGGVVSWTFSLPGTTN